jgi:hypothetical protein
MVSTSGDALKGTLVPESVSLACLIASSCAFMYGYNLGITDEYSSVPHVCYATC